MTTVDATVSAIDDAIGDSAGTPGTCCKCGRSLADSPSADFCSENCQTLWRAEHATVHPGHEVLDRVTAFLSRFNIFPSAQPADARAVVRPHPRRRSLLRHTTVDPVLGRTRAARPACSKSPNSSCGHRR
jgi:hypothetical protein